MRSKFDYGAIRTYRYKLYPTPEQKEIISATFKAVDFVHDYLSDVCEKKIAAGETIDGGQLEKDLTALKAKEQWMRLGDSNAVSYAVGDVANAYYPSRSYKAKNIILPWDRNKNDYYHTYTTTNTRDIIHVEGAYLNLPKLKKVYTKKKVSFMGKIYHARITLEPTNEYFVYLVCKGEEIRTDPGEPEHEWIEIDISGNDCLKAVPVEYLSGITAPDKKDSLELLSVLKALQSKQEKGSKQWENTRVEIAKLRSRIFYAEREYLDTITARIVKANKTVVLHGDKHDPGLESVFLSKKEFIEQIRYKCANYTGRTLQIVQ